MNSVKPYFYGKVAIFALVLICRMATARCKRHSLTWSDIYSAAALTIHLPLNNCSFMVLEFRPKVISTAYGAPDQEISSTGATRTPGFSELLASAAAPGLPLANPEPGAISTTPSSMS